MEDEGLVLYIHQPPAARPAQQTSGPRIRPCTALSLGKTLEAEYPEKTQTTEQDKGAKGGKKGGGGRFINKVPFGTPCLCSSKPHSAHDLAHAIELAGTTTLLTPSLRLKGIMEPWQLSSLAKDGV